MNNEEDQVESLRKTHANTAKEIIDLEEALEAKRISNKLLEVQIKDSKYLAFMAKNKSTNKLLLYANSCKEPIEVFIKLKENVPYNYDPLILFAFAVEHENIKIMEYLILKISDKEPFFYIALNRYKYEAVKYLIKFTNIDINVFSVRIFNGQCVGIPKEIIIMLLDKILQNNTTKIITAILSAMNHKLLTGSILEHIFDKYASKIDKVDARTKVNNCILSICNRESHDKINVKIFMAFPECTTPKYEVIERNFNNKAFIGAIKLKLSAPLERKIWLFKNFHFTMEEKIIAALFENMEPIKQFDPLEGDFDFSLLE